MAAGPEGNPVQFAVQGRQGRVYLPAVEDAVAPAGPAAAPADAPGGCGELVLVVDDEKTIRDLLSALLTKGAAGELDLRVGDAVRFDVPAAAIWPIERME